MPGRTILLSILIVSWSPALDEAASSWDGDYFGRATAAGLARDLALLQEHGLRVTGLVKNGPARRAGLRIGDRLVALEGLRVWDEAEWATVRWLGAPISAPLHLTVLRDGEFLDLQVPTVLARTGGFDFARGNEGFWALLRECGLAPERDVEPEDWQAWQQLPQRVAVAIVDWYRDSPRSEQETAWLRSFATCYLALCRQDPGAATLPPITAPTPVLQETVDLLQRIAVLLGAGEIVRPASLDLHPVAFVHRYPWPVIVEPPVGPWPDPVLAGIMADLRRLPGEFRGEESRTRLFRRGDVLDYDTWLDHYLQSLRRALIDGHRSGGWPYRHATIFQDEGRRRAIVECERLTAPDGADPWFRYAGTWLRALDGIHSDSYPDQVAAFERYAEELVEFRAISPFLAHRSLRHYGDACRFLHKVELRRHRWKAYRRLMPQLTTRPLPLLDELRCRQAGLALWDGDLPLGLPGQAPQLIAALQRSLGVEELSAAIEVVADEDHDTRLRLLDAWCDLFKGELEAEDHPAIARLVAGGGIDGAWLDHLPDLLWWQTHHKDPNTVFIFRRLCHPDDRDFDLAAIDDALATLTWDDPDAIEACYRRFGHPIGALRLADACASHGRDGLAQRYRDKVTTYCTALQHQLQATKSDKVTRGSSDWYCLMILASSAATAAEAISYGTAHFHRQDPSIAWTCAHLSMAQAHLARGDHGAAILQLCLSFEGHEGDGSDPFVGSFGLLRGEPAMRHWLLGQLRDTGALDAAARQRICSAAKPDLLLPASLGLLQATTADLLGRAEPEPEAPAGRSKDRSPAPTVPERNPDEDGHRLLIRLGVVRTGSRRCWPTTSDETEPLVDHPILLYDGHCGLCDGLVVWLLRRDRHGRLHFASLQSPTGKRLLRRHDQPDDPRSVVLVSRRAAYRRSDAILRALALLPHPWGGLRVARIVPRRLRDALYDLVSRWRYRLFGRSNAGVCALPEPVLRRRFAGRAAICWRHEVSGG